MSEMSLNAIREKFEGQALINLGEVNVCSLDQREECELTDCAGCSLVLPIPIEVKVDDIYSTRRSFLLDSFGLEFSIVISKTAYFEPLEEAELSETLAEQLKNLALEKLDDPKIFYVRTWQEETTRRHPNGWRFVKFVEKAEHANALLMFTRWEHLPSEWLLSGTVERYHETIGAFECGAVDTSAEIDGHNFGYEYWLFQYDPKADRLRIPSDPAEDKIDTFLCRQEIYRKIQVFERQWQPQIGKRLRMQQQIIDQIRADDLEHQLELATIVQSCIQVMPIRGLDTMLEQELKSKRERTQARLTEIRKTLAESEFAGQSVEQLQTEVEGLNMTIQELESKIHAYLDELDTDSIN